jgi:hypothetical protein
MHIFPKSESHAEAIFDGQTVTAEGQISWGVAIFWMDLASFLLLSLLDGL